MADWSEWVQFCVLSLIFAYMLWGLISIVQSFLGHELRIEREHIDDLGVLKEERATERVGFRQPVVVQAVDTAAATQNMPHKGYHNESLHESSDRTYIDNAHSPALDAHSTYTVSPRDGIENVTSSIEALAKEEDESLLSDEEDWEGIDGSDLDKIFGKAASYLEKMVLNPSIKIPTDIKLQFYGLFKQATEGPCSSPQPPAYRLSARAKWNAWKNLGDISPEEGMQRYVALLAELYPQWNEDRKDDAPDESNKNLSTGSRNGSRMGPVFSTMLSDSMEQEGFLDDIHKCAKEGDLTGLREELSKSRTVDQKDGDSRTALHWAADQGQLEIVKFLISQGADVNARDCEGQTPLHYATTCEWDDIAACLLQSGADPALVDNDGCTPYENSLTPVNEGGGVNT